MSIPPNDPPAVNRLMAVPRLRWNQRDAMDAIGVGKTPAEVDERTNP
jgi:hypothetical protein